MRLKFHFSAINSGKVKLVIALLIIAFVAVALAIGYNATTIPSTPSPSPMPTFSPEPSASPTPSLSPPPSPSPMPRATITLKITDTETEKFVDNVSVFVDGEDLGTTMQNGEFEIKNLEYGRHRISIGTYNDQYIFEQDITVSGNITLPISINMPNPVFQATVEIKVDYIVYHELGRVIITLANTGQIASQNTIALLSVYLEDNLDTPVSNRIVEFGTIEADAHSITKEIAGIDSFVWQKVERVVVVIIDRWKYTPESDQVTSQEVIPPGFTEKILSNTYTYIEEHPELNGSTAKIVLAW